MVQAGDNGALEQALANASCNIRWAGDPRFTLNEFSVSKCDGDFLCEGCSISI